MEKTIITENIAEIVESLGYLFIDIIIRGDNKLPVIEVFIDNEKGITTDDCVVVTHKINEFLESDKFANKNFRLDVSSPGAEKPIKYFQQLKKHLNRKFEITFLDGDETKTITGKLSSIGENELLTFIDKKSEVVVKFNEIKKAQVIISF